MVLAPYAEKLRARQETGEVALIDQATETAVARHHLPPRFP